MTCQRCVLTVSRRSRARRNWQLFIPYTPVPPRGPRREDRMAKLIGNFGFAWETKVGARFKFLLFARRILSDRSTNSTYRDRCHDTVILSGEFLHFPGADKSVVNGSGCREDVGEEGWFLSHLYRIKVDVRFLEWKVPVKYLLLKSICYIFVIKLYEISLESFFFNKCSKFIFFSCYKYFERNKYFCVNRMKGFL